MLPSEKSSMANTSTFNTAVQQARNWLIRRAQKRERAFNFSAPGYPVSPWSAKRGHNAALKELAIVIGGILATLAILGGVLYVNMVWQNAPLDEVLEHRCRQGDSVACFSLKEKK